ncbi:SoxR reducing system RseC family protein [Romboutsia sedimentorum]|uniref:SoxR reducing system RseC family protein n=1 Tax=Romboutsia sedimentorum TaxID=1368474 RepID=A0ABT7ECJ3_9FIRM|nr:SoxR reducing system RseC family protein [Romboutsia sedimentorum]MDK2564661.1 SoxR reducing system RseC family protein [Romboutsia sedimentorum]MDK2586368.1 SoxR reducing system RseC family protein [Romboutsia sedimentorum]
MEQQGYIVEIVDKKTAKLKMQRHSACASCGKCATTSEKKDIVVEVDNAIGAQVGDKVKVNMETVNVLKAAAIVYTVPLIALLIGTIATYFILNLSKINVDIEVVSGSVGIGLMLLSFVVLKLNDSKFSESREYIPVVTEVLIKQGCEIKL